jgi:uncharacterized protein (TIGR03435 family)
MSHSRDLNLIKKLLLASAGVGVLVAPIVIGLLNAPASRAQFPPAPASSAPTAKLKFEVASVKPSKPGENFRMIRPLPGGQTYVATNAPLRMMITVMYRITDSQIVGGPSWLETDPYDVEARAESPSSVDQLHEMFQTLLADRFKLQFHRETQARQAYVLTVDRSGSKIKMSENQEPFDIPIKPAEPDKFVGTRVPMSYLCFFLSLQLNVPVVDQTGLGGYYDFTLEWTPPPLLQGGPETPEPSVFATGSPDLIGALRKQLGLNLESRKAPVEVFVIDHVEKPSEN